MLGDHDAMATVAVRDLHAAARFYEDVLGLERVETMGEEAISYRSGATRLLVYRSTHAGTNRATAVTWGVDDVDGVVAALRAKGVRFARYDMPGVRHEGDVHVAGGMRNAWFEDPDGNIHAVVSG